MLQIWRGKSIEDIKLYERREKVRLCKITQDDWRGSFRSSGALELEYDVDD
jgi:hypothetical protein